MLANDEIVFGCAVHEPLPFGRTVCGEVLEADGLALADNGRRNLEVGHGSNVNDTDGLLRGARRTAGGTNLERDGIGAGLGVDGRSIGGGGFLYLGSGHCPLVLVAEGRRCGNEGDAVACGNFAQRSLEGSIGSRG